MEEAFTEKERITGLSNEELGPDLLALLGLQEQGWMNGLAPPPVEEDVREELNHYNHNKASGSRQVSRAPSHPCHVYQRR